MRLALIVEGEGDETAAPVVLRRLAQALQRFDTEILRPVRVPRSKLARESELRRYVELMARKLSPEDALLILLDADDDCPAVLGPLMARWARAQRPDRRIEIIVINREFEAWFLAGATSLAGKRGLPVTLTPPDRNPEDIRDAKGWLARQMPRRYHETIDQAPLAASFDLQAARACGSFERFARKLAELLDRPLPESLLG
jgi:hypothetical protein